MKIGTNPCDACRKHYSDNGPCDEGKAVASLHRADIDAARRAERERIARFRSARRQNEVA